MTWYLAILVVASRVEGDPSATPLVDRQYKLIRAPHAEDAYRRALELGAAESHDYEVEAGRCFWEFVGLFDLIEIDAEDLRDGVEVYYEMQRADPRDFVTAKEQLRVFWTDEMSLEARADLMGWDDPD